MEVLNAVIIMVAALMDQCAYQTPPSAVSHVVIMIQCAPMAVVVKLEHTAAAMGIAIKTLDPVTSALPLPQPQLIKSSIPILLAQLLYMHSRQHLL